jgi:hypothetical protein
MRFFLCVAAIVAASFAIFTSNPAPVVSYDTAPNSLLAFNLWENHRLDLDRFRGGYLAASAGRYAFVEAPNGHLTSLFPVGAAIVTLPLYAVFELARRDRAHVPPLETAAFEPLRQRFEKLAAAAVAAVSVGVFLLCALEIASAWPAAVATAVYALGTSLWSTASQALWQHGPVNLLVLVMVYTLFRANRSRDGTRVVVWLVAAGLCAGLLPVVRPPAALFSLGGSIFAVWTFRERSGWFVAALALGAAPGLAWNAYFFHSPLGGYAPNLAAYALGPSALAAFGALLVSPSRGILVFSPVLAFAALGVARARHAHDRNARLVLLLAAACVALVVQYACFRYWWAGFAYGPRFLTDIVAVAALLVAYAIPRYPAAFVPALLFSVGVQFVGVNSGAAGSDWNAVPVSIDERPNRAWQLGDNQIERNARAAYYHLFAWNIAATPEYRRDLGASIAATSPASIRVVNDGRSTIYGYDSGVYAGQLRVLVRVLDARRRVYSEQQLYVRGTPRPGERSPVDGQLALPARPGLYVFEFTPMLVGGGTFDARSTYVERDTERVRVGARLDGGDPEGGRLERDAIDAALRGQRDRAQRNGAFAAGRRTVDVERLLGDDAPARIGDAHADARFAVVHGAGITVPTRTPVVAHGGEQVERASGRRLQPRTVDAAQR